CLPQRFRDELPKLLPEVDAFMGIDQVTQVTEVVKQAMARRRKSMKPKAQAQPGRPSPDALKARLNGQSPASFDVNARPIYIPDYSTARFRLTPRHFAYVKIAEGCNHPCSFCIIPRMRGSHRSRQQTDIVREARQLVADGARELNLISQDTTYYGLDLRASRCGSGEPRSVSSPEKFRAAAS